MKLGNNFTFVLSKSYKGFGQNARGEVRVRSPCTPDLSKRPWHRETCFKTFTRFVLRAFNSYEASLRYMPGLAWRPKSVYSVVRPLLHRSPKAVSLELHLPLGHFLCQSFQLHHWLFLKLCISSEFNWAIAASIKYSWFSVHVTLWEIPGLYLPITLGAL